MALVLDTQSKYFKFGFVWVTFSIIEFVVLLILNQYLETGTFALGFIAISTAFFATSWVFRNQYLD
jgi:hypothetical protein